MIAIYARPQWEFAMGGYGLGPEASQVCQGYPADSFAELIGARHRKQEQQITYSEGRIVWTMNGICRLQG